MGDDQYRGLLTDREREIISGKDEVSPSYHSRVRTRIRNKVQILGEDFELLQNHEPDLAEDLQETICE